MTITGSRNRLTHIEYTKLTSYLRNEKLSDKTFTEVCEIASKFLSKPVTETTLRELLTEFNIEYKRLPKATVQQSSLSQLARIEQKLDTVLAQQQMILDVYTAPK